MFCGITLLLVIFAIVTCGLGIVLLVPYAIVVIIDAVLLAQRVNRGETIKEWQFF